MEQLKIDEQKAERNGELNAVAEILYGKIPSVQTELDKENKKLHDMIAETIMKEEMK